MNTITIELCAEDRARLDGIIAGLTGLQCDMCAARVKADLPQQATQTAQEPQTTEQQESAPAAPEMPAAPATAQKPAPSVTVADLQNKVVELVNAGKKPAVREVMKQYGVERVSLIPAEKQAEVMEKLTALEG